MLTTAYEPLTLGPITLPNRFIKAGANENMSKRGRPTRAMRMHHEELVKGGVGMTTMAYVAVEKTVERCLIKSGSMTRLWLTCVQ
jgi:2,4-dienoyl-CoA reductase-like NADH-dependent reductase (Old Yellow Enzyme family)